MFETTSTTPPGQPFCCHWRNRSEGFQMQQLCILGETKRTSSLILRFVFQTSIRARCRPKLLIRWKTFNRYFASATFCIWPAKNTNKYQFSDSRWRWQWNYLSTPRQQRGSCVCYPTVNAREIATDSGGGGCQLNSAQEDGHICSLLPSFFIFFLHFFPLSHAVAYRTLIWQQKWWDVFSWLHISLMSEMCRNLIRSFCDGCLLFSMHEVTCHTTLMLP